MSIIINDLSKVYKNGNHALKEVNLNINQGMYGLLGPNGAGKTTLMRILVTLMMPSNGEVKVNDFDLVTDRKDIRAITGYLPQDFRFFTKIKTWEFLNYVASLAGLKNKKSRMQAVDEMLEKVGLYEVRNRMASKLSGGMKRRLGIAQALIGDPKIVVVDEPTTGLDPEERIRFRNILSDLTRKDIIIVLSTHIVGDISSTCQNMALLNKGKVVFQGSPTQLIDEAKGHVWSVKVSGMELETIKEKYSIVSTIPTDEGYDVHLVGDSLNGYKGEPIEPNLEHGYVYFMDYLVKN